MEVMNLMNLQPTETAEVEASQQDSLSLDSGSIGEVSLNCLLLGVLISFAFTGCIGPK